MRLAVIVVTIVSRAYVPQARVLARSFAEHHPGQRLWALLIDDIHHEIIDANEPFNVLRLSDIDIDTEELHRMAMMFSGKLIAVIKPWVFEHFLARGAEAVIYIDGDFVLYGDIEELGLAAADGVVLVPHVLRPMPRDGLDPSETTILGAGIYNAGLFGVGPNHGGFLDFLKDRLRRECIFNASLMRFNEQRWLDFVPSLFPHRVIRDPGIDVAYWNLQDRPLSHVDGVWTAGSVALRAFHFSSFDPRTLGVGGRYERGGSARIKAAETPAFAALLDDYRSRLYKDGFEAAVETGFAFDLLPGDIPVLDSLRSIFIDEVLDADSGLGDYPPDPFEPSLNLRFLAWARDTYRRLDVEVPLALTESRISERALSMSSHREEQGRAVKPKRSGRFLRRHEDTGDERGDAHDVTSQGDLPATWEIDLVDRMYVGSAGIRTKHGITSSTDAFGFICHGPWITLSAGDYSVALQWSDVERAANRVQLDQALVVEAFVEGYAVGSRSATFSDVESREVRLDIRIPKHLEQLALFDGVELRILTRGGLGSRLDAVLLRRHETSAVPQPTQFNWLTVMAAGEGGNRAGEEVNVSPIQSGIVVTGPNWRLEPGQYQFTMKTRLHAPMSPNPNSQPTSPLAIVQAVHGDDILSEIYLDEQDLDQKVIQFEFKVTDDYSARTSQIGVRFETLSPIEAVLESAVLERMASATP
jgi:hypothetical protein